MTPLLQMVATFSKCMHIAMMVVASAVPMSVHALESDVMCSCQSVTSASLNHTEVKLKSRDTTSFMFSNDPRVQNITRPMFGDLTGTFACQCAEQIERSTIRYIISAISPAKCLNASHVKQMCEQLQDLKLMQCLSQWSSGMAGEANVAGVDTGTLVYATNVVYQRIAPNRKDCKKLTSFTGLVDSVIPGLTQTAGSGSTSSQGFVT